MKVTQNSVKIAENATKVLALFGAYTPYCNGSFGSTMRFVITIIISVAVVNGGFFGTIIHVLLHNEFEYAKISEPVLGSVSVFLVVYILVCFKLNERKCYYVLQQFKNIYEDEIPPGDIKFFNNLEKLSKWVLLALVGSVILTIFILLLVPCGENPTIRCGLYLHGYIGFDTSYTPLRQLYMTAQVITSNSLAVITVCVFLILVIWMQCFIRHIQHMIKMLMEIKMQPTRAQRKIQIKKCVLYHYRILALHKVVESVTELITLTYVSVGPACIGATMYHLFKVEISIVAVIHLGLYIFVPIANCIPAEQVITEGEKLYSATYDAIPWDGDVQTAKDLFIIMVMTSKAITIPAGKFGPLGLVRLTMILAAYSYMTLLLSRS